MLHLNCTALSQSESSNFFMYIINQETWQSWVTQEIIIIMSLTPPHFALLICDDAGMFMVFVMWKCSKLPMSWCGCKFILSYGCGVFMVILYVALWCQSDLWVDVAANHQPCVALWVTSDYEGEWWPMKSKKTFKPRIHQTSENKVQIKKNNYGISCQNKSVCQK